MQFAIVEQDLPTCAMQLEHFEMRGQMLVPRSRHPLTSVIRACWRNCGSQARSTCWMVRQRGSSALIVCTRALLNQAIWLSPPAPEDETLGICARDRAICTSKSGSDSALKLKQKDLLAKCTARLPFPMQKRALGRSNRSDDPCWLSRYLPHRSKLMTTNGIPQHVEPD